MKIRTRRWLGLSLMALTFFGIAWSLTQPLPYVILGPGPAFNVLGSNSGKDIIQVSGVPVDPTPGSLDLLTVSAYGVPGNTPNLFELLRAMFSTDQVVYPIQEVFPTGKTLKQLYDADLRDFQTSEAAAISAAKAEIPAATAQAAQVKLSLDNVGGPSGGLMFTLGIIDKTTVGSLTGGKRIAGTGTISAGGVVGPIGGIRQKLISAARAGDQYFLAPKDNCDEVTGHIPSSLRVFSVTNLTDALNALRVIASDGDLSVLPVCSRQ